MGREERARERAVAESHAAEFLICLNGEARQVRAGATVASLLAELGLAQDRVAVEVDRAIVRRGNWEGMRLTPGVAVEVVHFVGGG
jgi:thiamine biosynthesis protein ThiS